MTVLKHVLNAIKSKLAKPKHNKVTHTLKLCFSQLRIITECYLDHSEHLPWHVSWSRSIEALKMFWSSQPGAVDGKEGRATMVVHPMVQDQLGTVTRFPAAPLLEKMQENGGHKHQAKMGDGFKLASCRGLGRREIIESRPMDANEPGVCRAVWKGLCQRSETV